MSFAKTNDFIGSFFSPTNSRFASTQDLPTLKPRKVENGLLLTNCDFFDSSQLHTNFKIDKIQTFSWQVSVSITVSECNLVQADGFFIVIHGNDNPDTIPKGFVAAGGSRGTFFTLSSRLT